MTITRINPDLPLCWEDADTVRIGFERALARIRRPSAAAQRLIGSLCTGVPTARLAQEARRVGATAREVDGVLSALRPVLVEEPPRRRSPESSLPTPAPRVVISDDGRPAPGLREILRSTNACTIDGAERPEECDLIIHVERFLEPLERAQRWRASGMPHLLIRFTDRAVHVGPIIEPRGAPCHSCVSLSLVAADRALPVLATQLHGKIPQSETVAAAELAAIYAATLIRQRSARAGAAATTRWVIPIGTGIPDGPPRRESVPPHPSCSCGGSIEAGMAVRVNR